MENKYSLDELEQVMDEYVVENESLSKETLKEWIRSYPQYERELIDLTVALINLQSRPSVDISKEEEDILIQRGISVVERIMQDNPIHPPEKVSSSSPIQSLVKEASHRGLSLDQFSERIYLTPSLLVKIDRRLIRFNTIPIQLLEVIATTLDQNIITIVKYFNLQSTIPQGIRFKAKTKPNISLQVNFFEEIRKDPTISIDSRQYWLKFEPKNE